MVKKEKEQLNIPKKILSILPKLLYNILIVLCVILIAIIVLQRLTDSNRSIKGYKIFKVVSGSMIPKYDIGEVVICKDTPVEDIKIGNTIVYRGKIGDLSGKLVMHEVIAINHDQNNNLKFYARGLYNSEGDPEISESQIIGVVKFKSGILTLLYQLATSIYSSFIITTVLVINVFVSFKSGKVREVPKKELKEEIIEVDKEIENEVDEMQELDDLQNEMQNLRNKIEKIKEKENKKSKKPEKEDLEKDNISIENNKDNIDNIDNKDEDNIEKEENSIENDKDTESIEELKPNKKRARKNISEIDKESDEEIIVKNKRTSKKK